MLGQLPKKCTGEQRSLLRNPSRGLGVFLRVAQEFQSYKRFDINQGIGPSKFSEIICF